MTNSKKTQRKVALILVISLLIPLMNYYKQSVKADSTKTTTTTTSSTIGEISATDEVELVEDFTNSPVLKYVNAESFVKNNHVKRLKDEEELNTYMFKNADGTKTMYMMYENVKYIDKFGNVKDKDISLKLDNDTYRVNDNNVALSIPTTPQNGIEVNYDNNIVKITPVRNLTASKIVTTMENNAVTYKNYYGTGIDLRYTPLLSGVKEDIILSEYVQQTYTFTLETNGLNIYEKEGRYYLAKDEKAESIYDIGEVLVYDAVGRPTTGTMSITTKEAGKTYEISISVSDEYLKDTITVYPVTIDPTLTISDTLNGAGAIEDAPVFSGLSTAACGNYTYLSAGYVDDTYKIGRVLVRTPGLYNSTAYQNATMDDIVSVKFYCKDGSGNAASYVNLYPNISNSTWNENTVSWATGCNFTTNVNYGTTMSFGTWTSFDITHLVRAWRSGYYTYKSNMGFTLTNSNETSTAYRKAIFSSEYGVTTDRPYVEMTYSTSLDIDSDRRMVAIGKTHQISCEIDENSNISISQLTWTSGDTNIATVSSGGIVTGVSEGSVIITASYTDAATGQTVADSILIKVVDQTGIKENEEYFIFNKLSKGLLIIAGNGSYTLPPTSDGATISTIDNAVLSEDEESTAWTNAAKWQLIDRSNGLFGLKNVYAQKQLGANLTGTSAYLNQNSSGENFKFNIYRCNEGGILNLSMLLEETEPQELTDYKKGLYLICYNNMYLSSYSNGGVYMSSTITDGSYWSFSVAGDKNVKIDYTETENNVQTQGVVYYFNEVYEGATRYEKVFGVAMPSNVACEDSKAEDIINHIKVANFYIYRGHGFSGGLKGLKDIDTNGNTEPLSYVIAHDEMPTILNTRKDENRDGRVDINDLIDTSVKKENNAYINLQGNNSFASESIVLFIGCNTGENYINGENSYNLLEETYKKGASLVIGTTGFMETDESDKFVKALIDSLLTDSNKKESIIECLRVALDNTVAQYSLLEDRFVIIGDINQCFQYGEEE
ncbi:MAG: hypothetical protein E7252_05110 [Lachnospira sp.]|nr:hypothetical protein [Lachnospira sp.]